MADAPKKKLKFTPSVSPMGIAKFCWVDKPDNGFDGKAKPSYKTRVLIDDTPENRAWVAKVLAQAQAEAKAQEIKLKKVFSNPFKFPEDQDDDDFIPEEGKDRPKLDEDHRGKIFFNTKSDFKPALIDSVRQELDEAVKIMGGDTIKVKVEPYAFEGLGSGISLRLKVVQLIAKNTSYSGAGKANLDGFEDEDDYEAPQTGGRSQADLDDEIPF